MLILVQIDVVFNNFFKPRFMCDNQAKMPISRFALINCRNVDVATTVFVHNLQLSMSTTEVSTQSFADK